mgnify:CR=1 FL=1
MKHLYILLFSIAAPLFSLGQSYLVRIDSLTLVQLKAGKTYQVQTRSGNIESLELNKLEGDSLFFGTKNLHYSDVFAIKNPKRKVGLDILTFPATIGSCVAMSAFPIAYAKGYFLADTDRMIGALGLFLVESIVFAASRSYLSKNKKWLDFTSMKKLDFQERR